MRVIQFIVLFLIVDFGNVLFLSQIACTVLNNSGETGVRVSLLAPIYSGIAMLITIELYKMFKEMQHKDQ